jgi:hypothetical protein
MGVNSPNLATIGKMAAWLVLVAARPTFTVAAQQAWPTSSMRTALPTVQELELNIP